MSRLKVYFTLFCVLLVFSSFAQKSILKQANKYFEAEKFVDALELYNKIDEQKLNKENLYRKGVSNYFTKNSDEALNDFTAARRMGYDKKEIYYYAALALHSKALFKEASKFYKNYLRYIEDEQEKYRIINLIKQCRFGLDHKYNDQIAFVENLGPSFNTEYDEINPIQSPTSQNKYYFSSNRAGSHGGLRNDQGYKDEIYGNYYADMYAVELNNGNWSPASAFHPILNGPKNDLIMGFNPDGSVMYFMKTQDGITGQMYSDTFSIDKDPEAFPKQFLSPVICELGDKDLQVFNNNTLLFSSRRKGGYGGYDLYVSVKEEGVWGIPENLGPNINSKFNEITPFLAKSGKKLYFSSDRIESFGKYDVFEIEYNSDEKKWSKPNNVGLPINSALDEKNFSVSGDGMTAIFSSDRLESIGGSDIYLAYLKEQVTDQLMYTEALPFLLEEENGSIASENQEVNSVTNGNENQEVVPVKEYYNSPLYYGSDEIIMHPSNTIKMKGIKDLMVIYPELSITFSGHSPQEGMREFDLYFSIKRAEKAAEYLLNNGIEPKRITVKGLGSNFPLAKQSGNQVNSLADKNNRRIDVQFSNVPRSKLRIIEERPVVANAMKDVTFDAYAKTMVDLAYKIRVANTKQMYKADVIRLYQTGIVEKRMSDDSYTYTIGVFDSYNQVRSIKNELFQKGILDAKVVPYMNGEPLNSSQIEVLKESYSDLNEYLKFESE
ncbi:MAG: OmpA family protein [Saprospiraceae bacterium]|nr:OmpA family protein [Saprospiraceae bacterium]